MFCFSYLHLLKRYIFFVSIIIFTLFLQVLPWNFMQNKQHTKFVPIPNTTSYKSQDVEYNNTYIIVAIY